MTITQPSDAPTVPIDADEPSTNGTSPHGEAQPEEAAPSAATAGEAVEAQPEADLEGFAASPPEAEATAGSAAEAPAGVTAESADGAEAAEDVTAEASTEATAESDGAAAEADAAEAPEAGGKQAKTRTPRRPVGSGAQRPGRDRRTTAQRLGNFPRADKPAAISTPEHHHLPGWVRRDFARARPPLSNILALLEGEAHEQFKAKIEELNTGISSGKFSLAWQYPDLVDEGRALYEKQRREGAESARAHRQLDAVRRRVQDRIRDMADQLPADTAARLGRALRSAGDQDAINAVASELDSVATTARSSADKRREREIERTRARIRRSATAAGTATAEPQTETWQDVLRRFAEQQAAGSRSSE